ncbi:hypothetical protein chiPu_0033470, partial [Chiloscyllium punctatum]|nr:hypothetical protein [Chiloscyllium punctatum]
SVRDTLSSQCSVRTVEGVSSWVTVLWVGNTLSWASGRGK